MPRSARTCRVPFVRPVLAAAAATTLLAGCSTSGGDAATTASETVTDAADDVATDARRTAAETAADAAALAALPDLDSELGAMKDRFASTAPAETKALYEAGIEDVATGGVMESALKVGDRAPDFTLPSATGVDVQLSELLKDGPVIVTWYRGGWCPYCNIQLQAYQKSEAAFARRGARVVAISPERPEHTAETASSNELTFHTLSDDGNRTATAYGIGYRLPSRLIDAWNGRLDIPGRNGDNTWALPLSATYVIDQGGVIRYAYLDADYRNRAAPEALIEALDALHGA